MGEQATLKVTGERLGSSEDQLLASATIETSFDIKPKNCDSVFGQPAKSSGFPGLLGWSINLGGNDVLGRISVAMCFALTAKTSMRLETTKTASLAERSSWALSTFHQYQPFRKN